MSIKALSGSLDEDGARCSPTRWPLVILIASLAGLTVSARSLQLGKAVPVIAVTSATANVWTIAAGPIVFGEPLPDEPLALDGAAARLRARDLRRGPHAGAGAGGRRGTRVTRLP